MGRRSANGGARRKPSVLQNFRAQGQGMFICPLPDLRFGEQAQETGPKARKNSRVSPALPRLVHKRNIFRMNRTRWTVLACLLLVQGCALPRLVTLHDGLATRVVDARTKAPLSGAYAFSRVDEDGKPIVLGRSDRAGNLRVEAKRTLALIPLLGEAMVSLDLRLCKQGYAPTTAVSRGGWNADLGPSRFHQIESVELSPASSAGPSGCSLPAQ